MRKLTGKFEIYQSEATGEWHWRLRASNGQIIATSGEGYVTRFSCVNGMRSTRWNAMFASSNA